MSAPVRTPSLNRRLLYTWTSNFFAALSVLLVLKYALIVNEIAGPGGAPAHVLLPKSILFLGKDILGAAVFAALVTLLCVPWMVWARGLGDGPIRTASFVLQFAHALLGLASTFSTMFIGGPLNKAALDLALLAQPVHSVPGAEPAIWSSLVHYVTAVNVILLVAVLIWTWLATWYAPRVVARIGPRLGRSLLVVLPLEASMTLAMLPFLINGQLWGIRVHTYGLERSPFLELTGSYVKPLLSRGDRAQVRGNEFYFPLASPFPETAAPANPLTGARPQRTNVILITLESISQGYVEEPGRMPFLASIGKTAGGVYLRHHYSTWPQTMKALFSLACAELPYPFYLPITMVNPTIPCRSVSEALHDAGYYTAFITSADLAYDRKLRFFQHRKFDLLWDMNTMPGRENVWSNSWGLDERLTIRNILDVLAAHRDQPTFIWYQMAVAHHPYHSSAEHEQEPLDSDLEQYYRSLTFIDERLRELVQGVEARGLGPTLFVFVADHGEGFGQHPGSLSHGSTIYQENVRVPFAMLGPQLAGISGDVQLTTSHLDVAPTLLGLLGLEAPCTMKGRALHADSSQRLALFAGRPPNGQFGVADGKWKYILAEDGLEMMFDLEVDPDERDNRIAEQLERARVYRQRIEHYRAVYETLIEDYAAILGRSSCRP